jgi:hypothetical protein
MGLKFMPVLLCGMLLSSNAYSETCHYTCTPPSCYPYDAPDTWNNTTNNPANVPPGMNPDGSFQVDEETARKFAELHPDAWDHNPSTPRSEKTELALDAARIVLFQNKSQITKLSGFARTYVSLDGRLGPDGSPQPVVFVGIDDRDNPEIHTAAAEQAPKIIQGIPVSLQFYSEFKPFETKDLTNAQGGNDQNCTPPSDAELHPDTAEYEADDTKARAVLSANLARLQAIPGYTQSYTSLDAKERRKSDGLLITVIVVGIDDNDGPDNCADQNEFSRTPKPPFGVGRPRIRRCNKAIQKAALAAAPASLGGLPIELEFYSGFIM